MGLLTGFHGEVTVGSTGGLIESGEGLVEITLTGSGSEVGDPVTIEITKQILPIYLREDSTIKVVGEGWAAFKDGSITPTPVNIPTHIYNTGDHFTRGTGDTAVDVRGGSGALLIEVEGANGAYQRNYAKLNQINFPFEVVTQDEANDTITITVVGENSYISTGGVS